MEATEKEPFCYGHFLGLNHGQRENKENTMSGKKRITIHKRIFESLWMVAMR